MKSVCRLLLVVVVVLFARGAVAQPAMVVLVRHAEKAATPSDDPSLTPEGQQRARALAATLQHAGVTVIITTEALRTKETADPLAAHLPAGSKPEIVRTVPGDVPAHAKAVAAAVRRHTGEGVLVVGHSNTIPAIIEALGGPHLSQICDAVFDDLFVLVPKGDGMRLVQGRYGAPSQREGCAQMMGRSAETPPLR